MSNPPKYATACNILRLAGVTGASTYRDHETTHVAENRERVRGMRGGRHIAKCNMSIIGCSDVRGPAISR